MKNMKKLIALILTLVLCAGLFAACGNKAQPTPEPAPAGVYPLTVKDVGGVEMTLEKEPKAIVSLTLGTDEMLLGNAEIAGLVDKSRVVSVTTYAVDPAISNVVEIANEIPNKTLSEAEKIIALQPDLVFVDTWADPNFIQQLRDAKIIVYSFKTPSNIAEQRNVVLEIAHVVGADDKGAAMVAWMDEKLKTVEEKLKALKEEEKLTVMEYGEMSSSAGKGTNFDDVVTRAGLVNVVSKAGIEGWEPLNKEQMVQFNPDIIMLPSWYYDKSKSLDGMKQTLKGDKSLAEIKAIKNDKLIAVPNQHISAISQYVVLGVEDVARAAYPDLFK